MNNRKKPLRSSDQHPNKDNKSEKLGWLTADQKYYPNLINERKRLKKEMTEAEKILWEELRNKKLCVKFRRQHVVDCYIPDFVCLPLKLIIEVDGGIHLKQKARDNMRDERLMLSGYHILRFTNMEVTENTQETCTKIRNIIKDILCNKS